MKLVSELFEIEFEISNRLITLEPILRECFRNDSFELTRNVGHVLQQAEPVRDR